MLLLITLKVKTRRKFYVGQITKPKKNTSHVCRLCTNFGDYASAHLKMFLCIIPATTIILATESNEHPNDLDLQLQLAHRFAEDFRVLAL